MKNNTFFSVIIPVYNKASYIHRSVNSVLRQNYSDFELIIVNDASTDESAEEIDKFKDDRIRVFYRDSPGPGGYAARNLGIKKAKGTWVAFLDADDEWKENHLRNMYALSQQFPHVGILSCGWVIESFGCCRENNYYHKNKFVNNHIIDLSSFLKNSIHNVRPIWTSVVCFKNTSFIHDLFPDKSKLMRGGDLYAWLKLMCFYKKMAWSNHIGAIYYKNINDQIINSTAPTVGICHKKIFSEFSADLNSEESLLLRDYLNAALRNMLITSFLLKKKKINALPHILIGRRVAIIIQVLILYLMPPFVGNGVVRLLLKMKNLFKREIQPPK
jgi:glycosyltransferase involved in cell wall biosynthesis